MFRCNTCTFFTVLQVVNSLDATHSSVPHHRYVYVGTGCHSFMIPPHLSALFGNGPSDLKPQLCLEYPAFASMPEFTAPTAMNHHGSDEEEPRDITEEKFLVGFEALSVGYWDPLEEPADLSLQSWLHMWAHVHDAWM